jgi:hypothetical protein
MASPWVAVTVWPAVGFTGRSSTATLRCDRLSTVATMCRTMFCGTRNCSTGARPMTPASESCTTASLSFRAGSAAVSPAGIGFAICGSLLAAGAGAVAVAAGAAGARRDAYQYHPPRATAIAAMMPISHTTLRRARSS